MKRHFIAVTVTGLGITTVCLPAFAHQQYDKYKQPNGLSCCGGKDCDKSKAVEWVDKNGAAMITLYPREGHRPVEIRRDDKRVHKTLPELDTGEYHWCGNYYYNVDAKDYLPVTLCVIVPEHQARAPGPAENRSMFASVKHWLSEFKARGMFQSVRPDDLKLSAAAMCTAAPR